MGQWYHHQDTRAEGREVIVTDRSGVEARTAFACEREAAQRAAVIVEVLSWIGTPFVDCAAVKGPNGAVDCAMVLCRVYSEAGVIAAYDPGRYPPRWFQHRLEERFLTCIAELGGVEVDAPRPGDIGVWRFGKTYAHGGVIINSAEVCHAYAADGQVTVTRLDQPLLSIIPWLRQELPRPVKWFTLWPPAEGSRA